MGIEQTPTGLADIGENTLDETVFAQHCVSWSVAHLSVRACIDTNVPSASVEVDLAGVRIGHCILDPQHQDCTIGGGVLGFKAKATFSFKGNCLHVDAELCVPIFGCKRYSHNLLCW